MKLFIDNILWKINSNGDFRIIEDDGEVHWESLKYKIPNRLIEICNFRLIINPRPNIEPTYIIVYNPDYSIMFTYILRNNTHKMDTLDYYKNEYILTIHYTNNHIDSYEIYKDMILIECGNSKNKGGCDHMIESSMFLNENDVMEHLDIIRKSSDNTKCENIPF